MDGTSGTPVDDHGYIDPDLEAALISAVAADPGSYWGVRERLPATATDAFAARGRAWEQLARSIESHPSTVVKTAPESAKVDPIQAAEQLAELYWRRRLARMANETLQNLAAARPAREVAELLADALGEAREVMAHHAGPLTWGDALLKHVTDTLSAADAARAAGQRTIGVASSGIPTVDMVLNGWQPGGLYVLGGAPGVGKTSLALQWACHAIEERGVVVVYITYENSPQNLALKAIGLLAGVPPTAAERGRADPARWRVGIERFRAIAAHLALVPADAGTSVDFVEATTRTALARRSAVGFVVVDYLQRMAYGERFGTLQDNVAALAQRLRDLAVRLELPVLAISALAPSSEDAPLRLSALAERGELEYASDVVLLLGPRAEVALASANRLRTSPGLRLLDLVIAKNRYGEANRTAPLLFRPATGHFQEESLV